MDGTSIPADMPQMPPLNEMAMPGATAPYAPAPLPPPTILPPVQAPPPVDPMTEPYPDMTMFGLDDEVPVGPVRDEHYIEAQKPKKQWVTSDAEDMLMAHATRLSNTRYCDGVLSGMYPGHFAGEEEEIENNDIEVMPLNTLRADLEYNNGVISMMDPYVEHLSRDRNDEDEILAIEDAAYWFFECEARQYARSKGAYFRRALPNILQRTGALVGLDTVDPDDRLCGLRMSLIDPLTVFPVWGGDGGLREVFRIYEDTVDNIVGNYGEVTRRKVTRIAKGASGRYDRNKLWCVKEIWNKDWVCLYVEDEEIFARRHGLGRVPFTIVLGGFDISPGMSTGSVTTWGPGTLEPGIHYASTDQADIARYWQPWPWRNIPGHLIREAVAGRILTQVRNAMFPPMVYEFDPVSQDQDQGEILSYARHVNRIPLGNKLSVLPTAPDGPSVALLNQFLIENSEQGPWSQMRMGQIPSQTPDSALGTMFDLGGADRSALTHAIALFYQLRTEWRLELVQNFGGAMGIKGDRGRLPIPKKEGATYSSPVHELTPDIIERAGCYVKVDLFHWKPSPGMAQYMSTMLAAGLTSPETALRKSRYVPDPRRELKKIEDHNLNQTPPVLIQNKIQDLSKRIDAAMEQDDFETADTLLTAQIQLEFQAEMMVMEGSMAPMEALAGAEAQPQQSAGPPVPRGTTGAANTINQQGLSLPELNIGEGGQGGRPIGTTQATEMTQANRVTAPR